MILKGSSYRTSNGKKLKFTNFEFCVELLRGKLDFSFLERSSLTRVPEFELAQENRLVTVLRYLSPCMLFYLQIFNLPLHSTIHKLTHTDSDASNYVFLFKYRFILVYPLFSYFTDTETNFITGSLAQMIDRQLTIREVRGSILGASKFFLVY